MFDGYYATGEMNGEVDMKWLNALGQTIVIPLMLLNIFGSIVAIVWLGILGEWHTILLGVIGFILARLILGIALLAGFIFSAPALYFNSINFKPGTMFFGALAMLYTMIMFSAWCFLVLFLLLRTSEHSAALPTILLAYGVATGPVAYLAQRENSTEGGNPFSILTALFLQIAFCSIIVAYLAHISLEHAIVIFAAIMLANFILQAVLTVLIEREEKKLNRGWFPEG